MASTFTALGFEQQATGENSGTWGTKQNDKHVISEEWVSGVVQQAVTSSDIVLTYANGTTSVARHAVLEFTGVKTADRQITMPAVQKNWLLINSTTGDFTLTVIADSGSGIVIPQGETVYAYCDGTDVKLGLEEVTSLDMMLNSQIFS